MGADIRTDTWISVTPAFLPAHNKKENGVGDEVRFRALLERAQDSTEHIKSLLVAVAGEPKGENT
jgi:hypothetical protein